MCYENMFFLIYSFNNFLVEYVMFLTSLLINPCHVFFFKLLFGSNCFTIIIDFQPVMKYVM